LLRDTNFGVTIHFGGCWGAADVQRAQPMVDYTVGRDLRFH